MADFLAEDNRKILENEFRVLDAHLEEALA